MVCACVTTTQAAATGNQPAQQTGLKVEIPKYCVGDKWKYSDGVTLEIKDVQSNTLIVERHGPSRQSGFTDVILEQDLQTTILGVKSLGGEPLSKCDTFKGWKYLDFPLWIRKELDFKAHGISDSLGTVVPT